MGFVLRGDEGTIRVRYGTNDDPRRWGYEVLQQDWYRAELVRGFPVMEASVEHPAEGYAADMGWIQVVRYQVRDPGEAGDVTVLDVPPQLSETDSPYLAFGVRPTAFDAPAIGARDVTWRARTFLTFTPDAVISRVIAPLGRFTWGYDVVDGVVAIVPIAVAGPDEWIDVLPALRERFPTWTFLDGATPDGAQPPSSTRDRRADRCSWLGLSSARHVSARSWRGGQCLISRHSSALSRDTFRPQAEGVRDVAREAGGHGGQGRS
jgi:hypothetical protein